MHHITEMYMDQCGVSISIRTVVYEAGEMLFALLLENPEWKQRLALNWRFFSSRNAT